MINSIEPNYRPALLSAQSPIWDPEHLIGHPKQFSVISQLKLKPENSYAFVGDNSTGKTRWAWCLYRRAAENGRNVKFILLSRLLAQYRSVERGETVDVAVWPEQLEKGQWTICLDEIEKARPSEYAAEMLYQLINTVRSYKHQLIITSNSRLDAVADHWERAGGSYGHSIVKRIDEVCETIELFR